MHAADAHSSASQHLKPHFTVSSIMTDANYRGAEGVELKDINK